MLYERLARPWLFRMDPEAAHERVTALLSAAQALPGGRGLLALGLGPRIAGLETEVFGLKFPNPIGLAAGFDKDCRLTEILPALGFGFIEVGSITLRPQPGNPKPRIFRFPKNDALINRLGFNNSGVDAAASRLQARRFNNNNGPLGINIGLNADCPKEKAAAEYAENFRKLEPYGDYFAVNVSSPNTKGLRDLQEKRHIEGILTAIRESNKNRKPILVKISPDASEETLADLLGVIQRLASGVIATNTTLSRDGLPEEARQIAGGLSGAPLRARSTALIARIRDLTQGRLPIIGVGGVFSGADAFEKIRAGASLVQLYTGLIYRGPSAPRRIARELLQSLRAAGFESIAQAVGTGGKELTA